MTSTITDTINFPRQRPPLIFFDEIFLDELTESGDRGIRALLPISSGISVPPRHKSRISVSHPAAAFCPERLALGGDAQNWIINDILIGERSQISVLSAIAGDAGIPGEVFASRASDCMIKFETAQTSMLITLIVTYVGDDPLGAPFTCVLLGIAAT